MSRLHSSAIQRQFGLSNNALVRTVQRLSVRVQADLPLHNFTVIQAQSRG